VLGRNQVDSLSADLFGLNLEGSSFSGLFPLIKIGHQTGAL